MDNGVGHNFELLLVAKTPFATYEQLFTNMYDYLVKAKELEDAGFKIVSWYDKDYLGKLS